MIRASVRALALALLCWLAWAAPMPARAQPLVDPGKITILDQAQLCRPGSIHEGVPGPECAWKAVTLPQGARGPKDRPLNDSWFKLTFRLEAVPSDGLALFTSRFVRTGRVF